MGQILTRVQLGNMGTTNTEGEGIIALRGKGEFSYRIYCIKEAQQLVILLCGGIKSKQQSKDIKLSHKLKQEYKDRREELDVTVNYRLD